MKSFLSLNEKQMELDGKLYRSRVWKGIAPLVVPCHPQGHIPEIRFRHSGTSFFVETAAHFFAGSVAIIEENHLKCFCGPYYQMLSLIVALIHPFQAFMSYCEICGGGVQEVRKLN